MRHWIFGYGSLVHKEVAEKTGDTLSFILVILKNHIRNFRVLVKSSNFAAAGIERKEGAETLGMLVEVPEGELIKFDEREQMYDRVEVHPDLLELIEGELPTGIFYVYMPRNPETPGEDMPLAQSYIDVILEAFLNLDESLAKKVLETSLDFDKPWINDRSMPRYSRYLENIDTEKIDRLLKAVLPECFEKRREDPRSSHIKPELVESIMKAIAFFDLFDFPLNADEAMDYLYKYDKPVHIKEVKATLNHLVSVGILVELKGYYVLFGRELIIETRRTHKFIAEKFWTRTKLYGTYMKAIPFVEMIAVCNNLAYDNPSELSDIDLYIVVKPGRMWLARFLITIVLHFFGVRRHGDKIAGRFCLSFFVTDEQLSMQQFEIKPEDPYLVYWTKNLQPLYGEKVYQSFRNINRDWLNSYGLKFTDSYQKHMYHPGKCRFKRLFEWFLKGLFGNLFEWFLKNTLKKKTLNKMKTLGLQSNVIVSDEILKFHNHDRRQEFLESWQNRRID